MFEFQFDQFYKWLSQKYNQKLWNLQIKNSQTNYHLQHYKANQSSTYYLVGAARENYLQFDYCLEYCCEDFHHFVG